MVDVQETQENNTALHFAACYDLLDCCRELLNAGATTGLRNIDNETAYQVADDLRVKALLGAQK